MPPDSPHSRATWAYHAVRTAYWAVRAAYWLEPALWYDRNPVLNNIRDATPASLANLLQSPAHLHLTKFAADAADGLHFALLRHSRVEGADDAD